MLMASDTVGQVSEQTGITQEQALNAMEVVLPLLLKGMKGQASNKSTQKGFLEALEAHSKEDTSDVKKAIKKVDTEDGAKIVKHLLGEAQEEAAAKAKKKSGLDTKTILKIMAILAPILMSQMGKNAKTKKASAGAGQGLVEGILSNIDAADVVKIIGMLVK